MQIRIVTSTAALECRALIRSGGPILVIAVWTCAAVAFAQESLALRRSGLSFAWASTSDVLSMAAAFAPLLWILRTSPDALAWQRRLAPADAGLALGQVLGVSAAVSVSISVAVIGIITLERIIVGVASFDAALSCLARAIGILLPLAALGPAVVSLVERASSRVASWLLILAAGTGAFGIGIPIPLDRLLAVREPGLPWDAGLLAALLCATVAGLLLSLTLSVAPTSRARSNSCASASSATYTATSRR